MTRLLTILLIALTASLTAPAQHRHSAAERQQWVKEITELRHQYFARELSLTREQQQQFFPLYDKMDAEIRQVGRAARRLERSVQDKGDAATDLERQKAAEAMFEVKLKEGEIEMRYFPQFEKILTPTQLLQLKSVEARFNREMINKHQELHRKRK